MQRLRLLVMDPDEGLRGQFHAQHHAGIAFTLHAPRWPASPAQAVAEFDVVLVGVDTPLGLQALADLCGRPGAPPAIGIAGHGFEGKSLEHILLLAEVRGAAATMVKPVTIDEIAVAAWAVMLRRPANDPLQKRA